MSRFTAQKTPRGFGCTEAHVGELPRDVADPDDEPSNLDRHPRPGLLAYHSPGPSGDASSETGPRPEGLGRDPIIARVVLAGGRIGQSDCLIVELVDAGSTPVVILIWPAAEHSTEARGRFILDHDPAAAAESDGPQLTATNQPPHELSR
jgi:hypothetical protein